MTQYTYTVTCTAPPTGTTLTTCIVTGPDNQPPPIVKREFGQHNRIMYQYNKSPTDNDCIIFAFIFPNNATLQGATVNFVPLLSPKRKGVVPPAVNIREMTTLPNPFPAPIGSNFLPITPAILLEPMIFKQGINGRWGFSVDIIDSNNVLYHLDDPEMQLGTGTPP